MDKNEKSIYVLDCEEEDKENEDWLHSPPKVSCQATVLAENSTIKELRYTTTFRIRNILLWYIFSIDVGMWPEMQSKETQHFVCSKYLAFFLKHIRTFIFAAVII